MQQFTKFFCRRLFSENPKNGECKSYIDCEYEIHFFDYLSQNHTINILFNYDF